MTIHPSMLAAKACRECGRGFTRYNTLQAICVRCVTKAAKASANARKAAEREMTRKQREALKTRQELTQEAQTAFNAWIRLRDAGRLCICCGSPMEHNRPGGAIDAGHYLSIGSAPHLRFDEANCHAQRKSCNRPGGAKRHVFRQGMIKRVGLEEVERLEADQSTRKYMPDDLRAIRDEYRKRVKA